MEQETNEKVLAMYRAVWDLTHEGQNVYNMKVVDITRRAGIGKGTAYEYFRSKEELIAKALRYESYMEYERLLGKLKTKSTLKEAMDVCFDWMEEDCERISCLLQLFHESEKEVETIIRNGMKCMQENMAQDVQKINELLLYIVKLGKNEGSIAESFSDEIACLQVFSQLMGYFVFQKFNREKQTSSKETRSFLYTVLEKGFR